MRTSLTCCLIVLLSTSINLHAQKAVPGGKLVVVSKPYYIPAQGSVFSSDSSYSDADSLRTGVPLLPYTRQLGRVGFASYQLYRPGQPPAASGVSGVNEVRPPDWSVHGNILYNVDYRSYIDTPYSEKDIYYHTVQTYLDVTYKNIYPVRIYFTNRFSNSAFTRQFSDVSLQYNTGDYRNKIRQKIKSHPLPGWQTDSLGYWQTQLDAQRLQLAKLKNSMADPLRLQQLVAAKEHLWALTQKSGTGRPDTSGIADSLRNWIAGRVPGTNAQVPFYLQDVLRFQSSIDGLQLPDTAFVTRYDNEKKRIDSLQQQVARLEKQYKECHDRIIALQNKRNHNLDKAGSVQDLQKAMDENGVPDSVLPAGYKTLWAVKSLGVGRTMVNYSELSAKNVSINGFQVEYNPSYYVAVAAGTIDYRFRDLIVRHGATPGQHLYLVRVGRGEKEGNNIIATWYSGKKQLYNNSGSAAALQPDFRLVGFTLEGNYRLNRVTYITAEVAKSSLPYYTQPGGNKNLLAATVRFSERSNEAYSLKLQTQLTATDTRLTAFYKKYGMNFQSFGTITTGVQQQAWMVKADQPFFHKKLLVSASLKENDYTNPGVNSGFQSNIVFKSLQATLRLPVWPVVSVGYYPSSQLVKLADDSYTENVFYSLVANMNYYYKVQEMNMNSAAVFTRFYNKQSDSAFVYSNTTNVLLNQSFFFRQLTWQATAAAAFSNSYHLYTVDNEVQYNIRQWLSAGVGVKYNRQTNYNIQQVGYSANMVVKIKKLGEIQLMADKGFIPGANRQLVANNTGRFSFFRIF